VAAVSEEIAENALELIKVEYEVLKPVTDGEYGASPDSPLIHPDLDQYQVASFILPQPNSNISNYFKIRKGDADSAWEKCAAIVERKYRIPHIESTASPTSSTFPLSRTLPLPRWMNPAG
jgi:CO/xanthine dehydrogenase Mo-binding subunit